MRILVTGALGMIGSEIVSQLRQAFHYVIGVDDMSHPAIGIGESKADLLTCHPCCDTARHHRSIDLIIHCASPVGHAMLRPEAQTAWRIIRDTQAMLDLAQQTGARLITMSSSEVLTYKGETDIRAQYALGKLTSEAMVLGHPIVQGHVIRPYNVTGRLQRADGGFVMPRFRDAAQAGQPLEVFGSGEQTRHFTHVSDFARFVVKLVEKWPAPKGRWCVFNPGNGATINKLAGMFCLDSGGYVKHNVDGRVALDNPQWRDSSERPLDMAEYAACRMLDWEPQVSLEEIVREHLTGSLVKAAGE